MNNILAANMIHTIPDSFVVTITSFLVIDIFVFIAAFIMGVLAFVSNKSRIYNTHSSFAIASMVCVVFLSYVHQIYLLAFIVRIMFYVYIRYMISLLHTILLQPVQVLGP